MIQFHDNPIIKIYTRKKARPAPNAAYINRSRFPLDMVNLSAAHVTLTFSALHLSLSDGSWQASLKIDVLSNWMKFNAISARASGELQSPVK